MNGQLFIVRGQVQGVGFRPAVWRLASAMGLTGMVRNTSDGAEIHLWGKGQDTFADRLLAELPTLANIESIEITALSDPAPESFRIVTSAEGEMRATVTPDAATCADCLQEVRDPFSRRYRYPFTNCTACGPRFSIIQGAPYDRARTTLREFVLCSDCLSEFNQADDRRFHAQAIACHRCGPHAWLEHLGGGTVATDAFSMLDDVDAIGGALKNGHIVAIKGIGGFHLACDAMRADIVSTLRERKRRPAKAFALMARDVEVIRRFAQVSPAEEQLLLSAAAPIVLLKADGEALPQTIAPGLDRLGFMLPHTPIHHLMLQRMDRPIVMTSGNRSGQPQCISNEQARDQLADLATFALCHNRPIANRIDDSVVRVDRGIPRLIRRARGYAPAALTLPPGFSREIRITAMGSEMKNTFCLVTQGRAVVSQHMGDLENLHVATEAECSLQLFQQLFDHQTDAFAVDRHSDYHSTQLGHDLASPNTPLVEVQHHHAHVASCLAENGRSLDAGPVLGIVMDGSGMGDDGTIWGGEFLVADYLAYQREACLKPVALPGSSAAVREPWRNAYAHLMAEMGWPELAMNFADLEIFRRLDSLPRATLDGMIATGTNTPLASSCGRLFDAVAALTGLAWGQQAYEGEAAMRLEAVVDGASLGEPADLVYPFMLPSLAGSGMPYIEPLAMWRAVLGDLLLGTPVGTIAARFHRGLADVIVRTAEKIATRHGLDTVVLSGGCFQNAILFDLVHQGLDALQLNVLSHSAFPANDGGLALGQAVVALARVQQEKNHVSWNSGSDRRDI